MLLILDLDVCTGSGIWSVITTVVSSIVTVSAYITKAMSNIRHLPTYTHPGRLPRIHGTSSQALTIQVPTMTGQSSPPELSYVKKPFSASFGYELKAWWG